MKTFKQLQESITKALKFGVKGLRRISPQVAKSGGTKKILDATNF